MGAGHRRYSSGSQARSNQLPFRAHCSLQAPIATKMDESASQGRNCISDKASRVPAQPGESASEPVIFCIWFLAVSLRSVGIRCVRMSRLCDKSARKFARRRTCRVHCHRRRDGRSGRTMMVVVGLQGLHWSDGIPRVDRSILGTETVSSAHVRDLRSSA